MPWPEQRGFNSSNHGTLGPNLLHLVAIIMFSPASLAEEASVRDVIGPDRTENDTAAGR